MFLDKLFNFEKEGNNNYNNKIQINLNRFPELILNEIFKNLQLNELTTKKSINM